MQKVKDYLINQSGYFYSGTFFCLCAVFSLVVREYTLTYTYVILIWICFAANSIIKRIENITQNTTNIYDVKAGGNLHLYTEKLDISNIANANFKPKEEDASE